jgi:hypothetical protein
MKLVIAALLLTSSTAFAWDGYDYEAGSSVEIGKGNNVKRFKEVEYYDYKDGQYKQGEVQSVRNRGRNVEVEIQDNSTGKLRTFEMERR